MSEIPAGNGGWNKLKGMRLNFTLRATLTNVSNRKAKVTCHHDLNLNFRDALNPAACHTTGPTDL